MVGGSVGTLGWRFCKLGERGSTLDDRGGKLDRVAKALGDGGAGGGGDCCSCRGGGDDPVGETTQLRQTGL